MVGEPPHWHQCHDDEGGTGHLPEALGFLPCRRHVRPPQGWTSAALRVQPACAQLAHPAPDAWKPLSYRSATSLRLASVSPSM